MDINDAYYHGIRQQIRRVLTALGPARVDKALTAFKDGASNWNECFFARAYAGEANLSISSMDLVPEEVVLRRTFPKAGMAELRLMRLTGIHTVVPLRIVWHTFDGASRLITKAELQKFVHDVQNEQYAKSADDFLKSLNWEHVEELPVIMTCNA